MADLNSPLTPGPCPLAFVGMSGVGKSYWAKELARAGWLHLDCDEMIAQRLGEIVVTEQGEERVHAVGRWMGMPWSVGYAQREMRYLDLEREVTAQAIDRVASSRTHQPAVIDTTGSVIYTGDALLNKLRQTTRIVYFDTPASVRQQMIELYLREPKPVLWQGMYQPRAGESQYDALARCYADLLVERDRRYRALADVVLDYHALRQPGMRADRLIEIINRV